MAKGRFNFKSLASAIVPVVLGLVVYNLIRPTVDKAIKTVTG